MRCRLCGQPEEKGGETNFHVLWQCPGQHGKVKAARRKMCEKALRLVSKTELNGVQEEVVAAMWKLQDGVAAWNTVEELAVLFDEEIADEEIQTVVEAVEAMEGWNLQWARRGIMGAPWVEMMARVGMEPQVAHQVVTELGKITMQGCAHVWRAFTEEVFGEGVADGEELREGGLKVKGIEGMFTEEEWNLMERRVLRRVNRMSMDKRHTWGLRCKTAMVEGSTENGAAVAAMEWIRMFWKQRHQRSLGEYERWKLEVTKRWADAPEETRGDLQFDAYQYMLWRQKPTPQQCHGKGRSQLHRYAGTNKKEPSGTKRTK